MNVLYKSVINTCVILLMLFCGFPQQVSATHIVGSDISYKCTGVKGVYLITLVLYRDCGGTPELPRYTDVICFGTCTNAICPDQILSVLDCQGNQLGALNVTLKSVRDVNSNLRCPSAKSICDNMGCVTPGILRPGIERYELTALLDLNAYTIPPGCCNIHVSIQQCCRNQSISTIDVTDFVGFYTEMQINTCVESCNSSPELTNDPFAVICGGQPSIFNNGALDPDFDSLSFAFVPSLSDSNISVTYLPPYSYNAPMPWTGNVNGTFPDGISCNSATGDIMFTPNNGGGGTFVGVMAIEVKQWITTNSVPVLAGVTRRDIQVWVISCPPNDPPRLATNPSAPGSQPQTKWETCAGQLLCFDIIARDSDFKPPSISDTTYLSFLSNLPGATFTPNYTPAQRTKNGPREDSYKFCWQPTDSMADETSPYYFTVKALDSRCPFPGSITRAFSVLVHKSPKVIVRDTFACMGSVTMSAVGTGGNPPYTYRWYNNINDTLHTLNGPDYSSPGFTPKTNITRMYSVQVRSVSGCNGWDSVKVTVKQPLGMLADSARICYGDTFRLDPGNHGGNIRSYKWNTNPGDTFRTITRSDSNTYVVLMTDTLGCQSYDSLRLFVNKQIYANGGIDTSVCSKDTIQLNASGGQLYQWKNLVTNSIISTKSYAEAIKISSANTSSNSTNQVIQYEVKVYQSYPDTSQKVLECFNLDTVNVTVKPLPVLNKPIPWQMCYPGKGQTINFPGPIFNLTANPGGGTGVWSYPSSAGAIINGSQSIPSLRVDSLKNIPTQDTVNYYPNWLRYTYKAPQETGGCTNIDSGMVIIYGVPKVDAGNNLIRCSNSGAYEITDLMNQSVRGVKPIVTGTSYSWSMLPGQGGGLDSVISSTSKKYFFYTNRADTKPTNILKYTYELTYPSNPYTANSFGCENSDTTRFFVVQSQSIEAGKEIIVCKNEMAFSITDRAQASNSPTGQGFWAYSPPPPGINPPNPAPFGTIIDGKEFNPEASNAPVSGGSYMVYYIDTSSGCNTYDSTIVKIIPIPVVKISYLDQTKEATVCRNTNNYMLTTYIDKMDGTGLLPAQGITDKADTNYSYLGTPAWGPTPNVTGIGNAQFNSNDPRVDSIQWLKFKYTQQTQGVYCTNSDSVVMHVQDPPILTLNPGGLMCSHDSAIGVSATLTPSIYSIKWNSQDGSFGDDTHLNTSYSPNNTARKKETVWIYATTINPQGACMSKTDSTFISINPSPDARIICANCSGCDPLNAELTVAPTGVANTSYEWIWDDGYNLNTSDSVISRVISVYSGNGQYPVKLKVTTPSCTSISSPITIYVRAKPKADFEQDPPFTTMSKPYFNFINRSVSVDNSAMTYLWNMGPLPPNITADRMITETNPINVEFGGDTGWIPVRLYATTEFGCIDSITKNIRIEPGITVFAPTAFYPGSTIDCQDGDPGCNRVFKISATEYASIEIFVFNRWGQQVFYSNDAEKGWDGKFRGDPSPEDVYIYQVNATSFTGKQYKYSGSVTLLR